MKKGEGAFIKYREIRFSREGEINVGDRVAPNLTYIRLSLRIIAFNFDLIKDYREIK